MAVRRRKRRLSAAAVIFLASVCFLILAALVSRALPKNGASGPARPFEIPAYPGDGTLFVEINGNAPYFTEEELGAGVFERYSPLDELGRCGPAAACLGPETMPDGTRGPIGAVRPSGWHTVRYDDLIEDRYLYNRCHLIAYVLSGENDNERNLITGTRQLNKVGMLPFELETADYILETGRHVLYRVTPVFEGRNLVASGVLIEARSVEDHGRGLCFCVYVFNVQPGIEIDYRTGDSRRAAPP